MARIETKSAAANLKALSAKGTGSAVIATFNVVDKDGDVTLPGAFGNQKVKLVGGHDGYQPNIGWAEIREEGDEAIADFNFYLDMDAGKEWHKSVTNNYKNGVTQEYSYGYQVLEKGFSKKDGKDVRELQKLAVHEVSFVLLGAGENTRTLNVKSTSPEAGNSPAVDQHATGSDAKDADTATTPEPGNTPQDPQAASPKGIAQDKGDTPETKAVISFTFPGSYESDIKDVRNALNDWIRQVLNKDVSDCWLEIHAVYPDRVIYSVNSWREFGDEGANYEAEWARSGDAVTIGEYRLVDFDVSVEEAAVKRFYQNVKGATGRMQPGAKIGRVLSNRNRTLLKELAEALESLGMLRDTVAGDLATLLEETDPDRDADGDGDGKSAPVPALDLLVLEGESRAATARASAALAAI